MTATEPDRDAACRRRPIGVLLALAIALAGGSAPGRAQTPIDNSERLAFDRPEAWAMKYFASVVLLTDPGAAEALPPGGVELGFEAASVPDLSERQQTVGFFGTKPEDLDRTPAVARPRLRLGLPADLTLTLAWVPPIELDGVEADLVGVGLARSLRAGRRLRLGVGGALLTGTIDGDLVCSARTVAGGADATVNPFGCESPSRDELEIESWSLELAAAYLAGEAARWRPYVALGAHRMDLDMRIDARYSGFVDRTRLATEGTTRSAAAGVGYAPAGRWRAGLELFYSPLEIRRALAAGAATDALVHLRLLIARRLR